MNIRRYVSKGVLLLALGLVICSGLYTLSLSVIRQAIFPLQARSILAGPEIKVVGSSRQIGQPFTENEYVQSRPSAASYDASASTSSAVAASNDIVDQNRDFGAAVSPSLQPSPQKICSFYDC
jgi:K+-transporting ATPase ATPase C chain